jgi:hypothetical protein
MLEFTFDLIEWMPQGQKNRTENVAAVCGKGWIAALFRNLESTTRWIDRFLERSGPRRHNRKTVIGPRPKVTRWTTFEQNAGHLSESIAFMVMAE